MTKVPEFGSVKSSYEDTLASVKSMEEGLEAQKEKLKQYENFVLLQDNGVDIPYEYDALVQGIEGIKLTIESIESALVQERDKLVVRKSNFAAVADLLKQHGKCIHTIEGGDHDWVVTETFPLSGSWKKRHCSFCSTSEKLGHD